MALGFTGMISYVLVEIRSWEAMRKARSNGIGPASIGLFGFCSARERLVRPLAYIKSTNAMRPMNDLLSRLQENRSEYLSDV